MKKIKNPLAPKKRHPILRKTAKILAVGTLATAGALAVNNKMKGRSYGSTV